MAEPTLELFAMGSVTEVYATMTGAQVGGALAGALAADDARARLNALGVIKLAVRSEWESQERAVASREPAAWLYDLVDALPSWRPALLARLDDDDEDCVLAAMDALHALSVAASEGLVRGPAYETRRAWLAALFEDGKPRLMNAIANDTPRVRAFAASALGGATSGDAQVESALSAALRDDDAVVRRAAAGELVRRAEDARVDAVIALIDDPDPDLAAFAAEHAARFRDARATDAVIAALRPGPQAIARVAAARSLGAREAVPALLALLAQADDAGLVAAIAQTLVEHADASCVAPLTALLPRRDTAAAFAAIALARAGAAGAADALAAALVVGGPRPTRYLDMQAAALRALGTLGGPAHLAAITATFSRPGHDLALRAPALEALVRLDTPGVRPYCLQALPERGEMALVAVRGLGRCGDVADLPLLRRTLDAESPYLCEAAAISLATIAPSDDALAALDDTLVTELFPTPDALLALAYAWRALLVANPAAHAVLPRFLDFAHTRLDEHELSHRGLDGAVIDAVAFEVRAALAALTPGGARSIS